MNKNSFILFKETSGLTLDEAHAFLTWKINKIFPNEDKPVNIDFINKISEEAKEWKKTMVNK